MKKNNKYAMTISSSTGDKDQKPEVEVGHVDDKLKPSAFEEIVTLKYGPRHHTKAVVTKGLLNERFTDNAYSEYGRVQYWHEYIREDPLQKTMTYRSTKFHDFQPYSTMDDKDLEAMETDFGYIASQADI